MNKLIAMTAGLLLTFAGSPHAAQINIGLSDVIATVEKSFRPTATSGGAPFQNVNQAPPVSDFSANFFQRTFLVREQREMRADGQMSVKLPSGTNPLMYRFEYFRPAQQEIISNGRTLWIYHPENREVIMGDVSFLYNSFKPAWDQGSRSINLLDGLGTISRDFQINFASGMYDPAGNYVLELNPRRSMLNTRRILLVVNRESVLAYTSGKTPLTPGSSLPSPRTQGTLPQPRSPFGTPPPFGPVGSDPFPVLSTTVYDHEGNSTTIELSNIQVNSRIPDMTFSFVVPGNVQVIRPSEQNLPR